MKRVLLFLAFIAVVLILASPVLAKGKASITPGDGPFHFGESYSREAVIASWNARGNAPDGGYWARIDCYQTSVVYAQYNSLSRDTQTGFTFGPTPSWSGGGADCQLSLLRLDNGVSRLLARSEMFPALP